MRAFTMILLGLLFATLIIVIVPLRMTVFVGRGMPRSVIPPQQGNVPAMRTWGSKPPQEKAVGKKFVFTLNEVIAELKHPAIPVAVEADKKKLGYDFGIEDATGQGKVRTSSAKVGVNYKVSQNSTVGVELKRGLHDAQDAAAWGKSVDDENAAQAKYKLLF